MAYERSMARASTLRERLNVVVQHWLPAKGMTQNEWCERAEISRQAVLNYRKGVNKTINYEAVQRLADVAGLDRAWLLAGVDTIPQPATGPSLVDEITAKRDTKKKQVDDPPHARASPSDSSATRRPRVRLGGNGNVDSLVAADQRARKRDP